MLRIAACVALLSATSVQAQTVRKPIRKPAAMAAKPAPRPAPEPWRPRAFTADDALPANYKGEDAVAYLGVYKGASSKATKDQFETTAAYEARMANPSALIAPIDINATYAFQYQTSVKYDADKQAWMVGGDYRTCNQPGYGSEVKGVALCKVGERLVYSEYEGSNSYGAKAKIDKTTGDYVSLAIPGGQLERAGFKKEKYLESYGLTRSIPMPLEQAAALRDMKIALLLVGSFSGATIVKGRGLLVDPTISKPSDIFIQDFGLPFRLKEVIFYVQETGQILDRIKI